MKPWSWWKRNSPVLALVLSIMLIVTLFYLKGTVHDKAFHSEVLYNLRMLSQYNDTLNHDILRARNGLLHHYDGINATLNQLRNGFASLRADLLRDAGEKTPGLASALDHIDAWLSERADLVESFKSNNGTLLNSTRYLPFAAEALIAEAKRLRQFDSAEMLGKLARTVLRYQVVTTPDVKQELESLVNDLRRRAAIEMKPLAPDVEMLMRHAMIIARQHDQITQVIQRLFAEKTGPLDRLHTVYDAYTEQQRRSSRGYQSALYAVAIFFIGSAAYFARRHARTAKRVVKLLQAVEQSPNAVMIADKGGRIEYVNRSFLRQTGYEAPQLIGARPVHQPRDDGAWPAVITALWTACATGQRFHGEVQTQRKTGAPYWAVLTIAPIFGVRGQTTHFLALHSDISESRRMLDAVRESEARYRSLFDHANDAIYLIDSHTRNVVDCNVKASELSGYSHEQLCVMTVESLFRVVSDTQGALTEHVCDEFVVSDFSVTHGEIMQHSADGRLVPVEVRTAHIALDGQDRVLAIVRDITERREAERMVQRHRDQLEELVIARTAELARTNRELEAFAYSVSHDLRAPLRALSGFSQALIEDCDAQLGEKGRGHIRRIRTATQKMGGIIDSLLLLSRVNRSELRVEPVDLSGLVHDIVSGLQTLDPRRNVHWIVANDCDVVADPRLISIALENLLNNAWKFTGKTMKPEIEFGKVQSGAGIVYFVRDNGVGFNMEYAEKLFRAFQRLHSERDFEGYGIGLSIVYRIINRHGGRLWAESRIDRGATFFFMLGEHAASAGDDSVSPTSVTRAA